MTARTTERIRDCALALAVPFEWPDFAAQLDPGSPREYAKWYKRNIENGGSIAVTAEWLWSTIYEEKEAKPIRDIAEDVRRRGVEVVLRCTLSNLSDLLARKRVVMLVAHWHVGALQRGDLRDANAFIEHLRSDPDGYLAAVREQLSPEQRAALVALELADTQQLDALLGEVNAVLESGPLKPRVGGIPQAPLRGIYYTEDNRALLEQAYPDQLRSTGGLELEDGTFPKEAVAAAVPTGYNGVLDMSTCYSIVVAEHIKRQHPQCRIIANVSQTYPAYRLLIFQDTVRRLSHAPGHYVDLTVGLRTRGRP
jgi:hypothetical protein